jgi:hypothetical protein
VIPVGDFADRMHAEHIDHLEEIIRLLTIELEAVTKALPWVQHAIMCRFDKQTDTSYCSCDLLEVVQAIPVDLFSKAHHKRLTIPAGPRHDVLYKRST